MRCSHQARHIVKFSLACLTALATATAAYSNGCTQKIDIDKSIVIHKPALLKEQFALKKVLKQMLSTIEPPATADDAAVAKLLQTMISSFAKSEEVNPISNLVMKMDPRPGENKLDVNRLLNPDDVLGLVPVGLFNRLDLAPETFQNCGEYRIVYSFKAPVSDQKVGKQDDRFFLIFEAKLGNPFGSGASGCIPVAKFWQGLTEIADENKRVEEAEKFFFQGLPNSKHLPAIHADHFNALGQVRGNIFVEDRWQLREWKFLPTGDGALFTVVTVKANPLAELYKDSNNNAEDRENQVRLEFHDVFKGNIIQELLEAELNFIPKKAKEDPRLDPKSDKFDKKLFETVVINRIGSRSTDDRFNEFQSDSEGDQDIPETHLGSNFKTSAEDALKKIISNLPDNGKLNQKINIDQLIARAGAITCGGCHRHTTDKPVGNAETFKWPADGGFVHIAETGSLSPALTDRFLPFRRDNLEEFLCKPRAYEVASADAFRGSLRLQAALAQYQQTLSNARLAALQAEFGLLRAQPPGVTLSAENVTRTRQEAFARFQPTLQRLASQAAEAERDQPGAFVTNRRPH